MARVVLEASDLLFRYTSFTCYFTVVKYQRRLECESTATSCLGGLTSHDAAMTDSFELHVKMPDCLRAQYEVVAGVAVLAWLDLLHGLQM